ncbi:hypothetical protein FHW37_101391 [Neorhizobium alkalisoli]|uniref:Uncharacterized protein n=1 Tax=Neorhizobium alkalisoli TaxID=528178 RepID=A0A561R7K0_9HYPH|nr:hypothetical protein FHW37_101391 [Neorhizobium alkalisoli]
MQLSIEGREGKREAAASGGSVICPGRISTLQALRYKGFVTEKISENASFLLHAKKLHHNVMPI